MLQNTNIAMLSLDGHATLQTFVVNDDLTTLSLLIWTNEKCINHSVVLDHNNNMTTRSYDTIYHIILYYCHWQRTKCILWLYEREKSPNWTKPPCVKCIQHRKKIASRWTLQKSTTRRSQEDKHYKIASKEDHKKMSTAQNHVERKVAHSKAAHEEKSSMWIVTTSEDAAWRSWRATTR